MTDHYLEPDLTGLFNGTGEWTFARHEICQREEIWPNFLAYSETQATLCLIAKQSPKGEDFAVGETGIQYLEAALKTGAMFDDKPVQHAFVVLVVTDAHAKDRLHAFRAVQQWTVQQTRERIQSHRLNLESGNYGPFYWIRREFSGSFSGETDEWTRADRKTSPDTSRSDDGDRS